MHHVETDGGTEHLNAVLEQYLQCFINFQQDTWVDLLALMEFVYNNVQHTSTDMFPFLEVYGFHLVSICTCSLWRHRTLRYWRP